ncbi:hypothetical protein ACFSTC_03445 [Nonomuraea ferruginea]
MIDGVSRRMLTRTRGTWTETHQNEIAAARTAYDARVLAEKRARRGPPAPAGAAPGSATRRPDADARHGRGDGPPRRPAAVRPQRPRDLR